MTLCRLTVLALSLLARAGRAKAETSMANGPQRLQSVPGVVKTEGPDRDSDGIPDQLDREAVHDTSMLIQWTMKNIAVRCGGFLAPVLSSHACERW